MFFDLIIYIYFSFIGGGFGGGRYGGRGGGGGRGYGSGSYVDYGGGYY